MLSKEEILKDVELLRLKSFYLKAIEDYNHYLAKLYESNGFTFPTPEVLAGRSVIPSRQHHSSQVDLSKNS